MEEFENYRPNVAAIVLSSIYPQECKIFIAQRNDLPNVWQFPQGGIDSNEKAQDALLRELEEEIGTSEVEILCEYPQWIKYDFPPNASKKFYPTKGQVQKYFLVRLKSDDLINIHTKNPEFSAFDFVKFNEIFKKVNHFKKPIYKQVLKFFKQKGYL